MSLEYRLTKHGNVQFVRPVGDATVVFEASDFRRVVGHGVKAVVKLAEVQTAESGSVVTPLGTLRFELEDGRDIKWLAGQAHGRLNGAGALYPKDTLENDLMTFCAGAYGAWAANANVSGWVMGDPEPSAPPWELPGLILAGSTGIAFGDAKANKSTMCRVAAQSLQYGVTTLFPSLRQGNVVWVNAEESPAEHSRQLGNVNAAIGLERIEPLYTVDARGVGAADVAAQVRSAVEKTNAKHIFVDSLSRLAQGGDLNENSTATMLIDSLAGLPCSVTWIGHTGHENRHRLAGSKHFLNAARLMVRVQSRISTRSVSAELRRGVRITVTDANGAAPVDPQFFTLEYHRNYGLQRIERSTEEEWPELRCQATYPSKSGPRDCGRWTWDGLIPGRGIRCDRHRDEEDQ